LSDLAELLEREISFATLDSSNVAAVNVAFVSQIFLRKIFALTHLTNPLT
jgi:hypothetical protein